MRWILWVKHPVTNKIDTYRQTADSPILAIHQTMDEFVTWNNMTINPENIILVMREEVVK